MFNVRILFWVHSHLLNNNIDILRSEIIGFDVT